MIVNGYMYEGAWSFWINIVITHRFSGVIIVSERQNTFRNCVHFCFPERSLKLSRQVCCGSTFPSSIKTYPVPFLNRMSYAGMITVGASYFVLGYIAKGSSNSVCVWRVGSINHVYFVFSAWEPNHFRPSLPKRRSQSRSTSSQKIQTQAGLTLRCRTITTPKTTAFRPPAWLTSGRRRWRWVASTCACSWRGRRPAMTATSAKVGGGGVSTIVLHIIIVIRKTIIIIICNPQDW